MSLTIKIEINGRTIATAEAHNISGLDDLSSYSVASGEHASDVTGLPERFETFEINDHERRQSAWALVEKIAARMKEHPNG